MQIIEKLQLLRTQVRAWRAAGQRIALVPTMGNLHVGHIELAKQAQIQADHLVVSVFVNPLQFGQNEDFGQYPRTPEEDADQLRAVGTDILFMPAVTEVYPQGLDLQSRIEVPGISDILCGAFRPGHFSGVATVVNMLFNMVQPDVALFGEKDYQQLQVIRSMTGSLHLPIEIVSVPTVRDPDGLALSSRNRYLSVEERARAPILYRALQDTAAQLRSGQRNLDAQKRQGKRILEDAGLRPDYYEILCPDLTPPGPADRTLVILAAAWLGKARLIDNIAVSF